MKRSVTGGEKFLIGFAATLALGFGSLAVGFVSLDALGRLKAPSFANRLSFDEKVRHLRAEPVDGVDVLLVGSSTTLHGLDASLLRRGLGVRGEVLNWGVRGLHVNQIQFLTAVFLPRYPLVRQVITLSTLLDFKYCDDKEIEFFDREHIMDYMAGGGVPLYYYFKYLDLRGVVKYFDEIGRLRQARDDLESVAFDRDGSILLDVPREHLSDHVRTGAPILLDPRCYDSLRAFAQDLRAKGIKFTYVVAPMRPGYLQRRDPNGTLLAQHRRRLHEALQGTDAIVIDAHEALDLPEPAFFDAYHLKSDEARQLTRFLAERLLAERHRRDEARPSSPAAAIGLHPSPGA